MNRLPHDSFGVEVPGRDQPGRVRVRGEVDLATARLVCDAIEEARRTAPDVLLDLREVTFMDSTGISMLIDLADESRRDGFAVAIAPSAAVHRILRLTGVADLLPLAGEDPDPEPDPNPDPAAA